MYKFFVKRSLEFIFTFLILLFLMPIFFLVALLVLVNLGSPIYFKQSRPGLNGKVFNIFKFRTMTNKHDNNGILLPDKDRITKFGQFLRSTSLDELPSLWSVLNGDMSLIGPRPLLVEYLPLYSKKQARRHEVRPGVTGWAQVNGRNAISWDLGHSLEDRHISEKRRSRLCKLLSDQDISVICAALSNAPDLREWNKQNINNYFEIYIQVEQSVLHERDSKGLYNKYSNKEIINVVGDDIPFHEPENPWITIDNNGEKTPDKIVDQIMLAIKKDKVLN